MTNITSRLERCYTGVVHDVMRAMGFRDFTSCRQRSAELIGARSTTILGVV